MHQHSYIKLRAVLSNEHNTCISGS